MHLNVFCYYPHHYGTLVTEAKLDVNLVLLMQQAAKDDRAEQAEVDAMRPVAGKYTPSAKSLVVSKLKELGVKVSLRTSNKELVNLVEQHRSDLPGSTTLEELLNGTDLHEAPAWKNEFTKAEHLALKELVIADGTLWGFADLFTDNLSSDLNRGTKMLNALKRKGWFVVEWEEGSIGIALDGFTSEMKQKMRKIEAQHAMDEMDF